jgi:hypothetical protein
VVRDNPAGLHLAADGDASLIVLHAHTASLDLGADGDSGLVVVQEAANHYVRFRFHVRFSWLIFPALIPFTSREAQADAENAYANNELLSALWTSGEPAARG